MKHVAKLGTASMVKAQAPITGRTTTPYTIAEAVSLICSAVSLSTPSSFMPQAQSTASEPQPTTVIVAPKRPNGALTTCESPELNSPMHMTPSRPTNRATDSLAHALLENKIRKQRAESGIKCGDDCGVCGTEICNRNHIAAHADGTTKQRTSNDNSTRTRPKRPPCLSKPMFYGHVDK